MQLSDDYRIRHAEGGDREGLAAMWTAFLEEQSGFDSRFAVSDDALERWRNDFPEWVAADVHGLLVAVDGEERLIGFASVHLWYPAPIYNPELQANLDELFVTPSWRRRGVASALLDAVRDWARAHDAHRIRLGVLSANENGLSFWESSGARQYVATFLIDV